MRKAHAARVRSPAPTVTPVVTTLAARPAATPGRWVRLVKGGQTWGKPHLRHHLPGAGSLPMAPIG